MHLLVNDGMPMGNDAAHLQSHDETQQGLLDLQVCVWIILISEDIRYCFAQSADESVPDCCVGLRS